MKVSETERCPLDKEERETMTSSMLEATMGMEASLEAELMDAKSAFKKNDFVKGWHPWKKNFGKQEVPLHEAAEEERLEFVGELQAIESELGTMVHELDNKEDRLR